MGLSFGDYHSTRYMLPSPCSISCSRIQVPKFLSEKKVRISGHWSVVILNPASADAVMASTLGVGNASRLTCTLGVVPQPDGLVGFPTSWESFLFCHPEMVFRTCASRDQNSFLSHRLVGSKCISNFKYCKRSWPRLMVSSAT